MSPFSVAETMLCGAGKNELAFTRATSRPMAGPRVALLLLVVAALLAAPTDAQINSTNATVWLESSAQPYAEDTTTPAPTVSSPAPAPTATAEPTTTPPTQPATTPEGYVEDTATPEPTFSSPAPAPAVTPEPTPEPRGKIKCAAGVEVARAQAGSIDAPVCDDAFQASPPHPFANQSWSWYSPCPDSLPPWYNACLLETTVAGL